MHLHLVLSNTQQQYSSKRKSCAILQATLHADNKEAGAAASRKLAFHCYMHCRDDGKGVHDVLQAALHHYPWQQCVRPHCMTEPAR